MIWKCYEYKHRKAFILFQVLCKNIWRSWQNYCISSLYHVYTENYPAFCIQTKYGIYPGRGAYKIMLFDFEFNIYSNY